MTQSNKRNYFFAADLLALTILAIVLRTVSLFNCFDHSIGYYDQGAVLPTVFHILCIATALCIVGFSLFALPKSEKKRPMNGKACRAAALLSVAAFACLAWERWQELLPLFGLITGTKLITPILSVLLPVAALVFFVAVCIGLERSPLSAISGILTFCFFVFELITNYTDMTVAMNSPNKVLFQFAALSAMLFMVAELKLLWGAEKQNRSYTLSLILTVFLTGTYSLPNLISAFFGEAVNGSRLQDLVFAALFVLAAVRLITNCLPQKEGSAEEEEATTDDSAEEEVCEEYEEGYENPADTADTTEATEETEVAETTEATEETEQPKDDPIE